MSRGRNDEALRVFQLIYRLNGRGTDFPITVLADENFANKTRIPGSKAADSSVQSPLSSMGSRLAPIKAAFRQMKPIFEMPRLKHCVLVFVIQFGILGR